MFESSQASSVVLERAPPTPPSLEVISEVAAPEEPEPIMEISLKEPVRNVCSRGSSVLYAESFEHFVLEPHSPKAPETPKSVYIPEESVQLDNPDFSTNIAALGKKYIDQVDAKALKRWYKNVRAKQGAGGKNSKKNSKAVINDMMKFGKLFNAYGNDQIAIVNPADRPDMIQIKNRS